MHADHEEPLDARPHHVGATALTVVVELLGDAEIDPADHDRIASTLLTGITLGSQSVEPGDLYAALPGAKTHGARFAADAVGAGAAAILTDAAGAARSRATGVPVVVVADPRERLGAVASALYGHPSERVVTIGVTGTQGKTTSTYLAESGLRGAGTTPAVVGTIGTRIDGRPVSSVLTTPEAPQLHALFAVMLEQGVGSCAMEVSSHAIVKGRIDGVVFDVAVFLNLGRDHLDFHVDLDDYFDAKARLFQPEHARRAVINVDDEHGRELLGRTHLPVTTFSTEGRSADWQAHDLDPDPLGTSLRVEGPGDQSVDLRVPLTGAFNVSNALAVMVALVTAGYDARLVADGIGACRGVPGRMERIDAGQNFTAFVDYAHKPDAVEAILEAARPITIGRVVLVIGAGGDRDAGKRPLMGQVAARLADVVIVTDDNPRTEPPGLIRAEVVAGAGEGTAEIVEVDGRRAAIEHAVRLAGLGDCVIVAGKGHERGQEIDGVVHPFDDREVLREAILKTGATR